MHLNSKSIKKDINGDYINYQKEVLKVNTYAVEELKKDPNKGIWIGEFFVEDLIFDKKTEQI